MTTSLQANQEDKKDVPSGCALQKRHDAAVEGTEGLKGALEHAKAPPEPCFLICTKHKSSE